MRVLTPLAGLRAIKCVFVRVSDAVVAADGAGIRGLRLSTEIKGTALASVEYFQLCKYVFNHLII